MTVRYHTRRGSRGARLPVHARMHPSRRPGAANTSPAPTSTPRSANCCSTPSPRSRSRSRSPSKPSCETRADEADQLRRHHVERARHHADLARRRYLAVDPDNRLVADTLEADWNDALRARPSRPGRLRAGHAAAPAALTDEHQARIRALATDFPALWTNPATPQRERKRMARLLIDDVTLAKTDQHPPPRPVPRRADHQPHHPHPAQRLAAPPDPPRHPRRCSTDSSTSTPTPTPPKRSTPPATAPATDKPFTGRIVLDLRRAHHLPSHAERLRARGLLTIHETAERLGVHPSTIKAWHRAGLLTSHKANDKNDPALRTTRPRRPPPRRTTRKPASATENPPNPRQEVQYETHALSKASPTVPMDGAIPASTKAVVNAIDVYCDPASE